MCGITGIISFSEKNLITEDLLTKMRDTMVHRGPDGEGNWISNDKRVGIAHRRLSIVDLTETASQPMSNEDGNVIISFNGEIYNAQNLKSKLKYDHTFKTNNSDTEVLIHGYEEWGIDKLLEKISGDFAFAIWDEVKQKILLVRDRVGVKPIYFYIDDNKLIFGSEIKAILAHPNVDRDINPIAMYHYLSFMTTPAPFTMFKGIYKIPSGHYLTISKSSQIEFKKYWDPVPNEVIKTEIKSLSGKVREEFLIKGIRSRFENAVDKRNIADVNIGALLSGGVDSSTNVAIMSNLLDTPIDTYSIGFKDYTQFNELDFARQMSKKFKTNHHETLISQTEMISYINDLIFYQDEPIADSVCIPLNYVSKLAVENNTKVIQVGEGSDEQFCGYRGYMTYLKLYQKYWKPYQKFIPEKLKKILSQISYSLANGDNKKTIYADIIDRATRDREHFWGGATVFWESQKKLLLNSDIDWSTRVPKVLEDIDFIPKNYKNPDSFNIISSHLAGIDNREINPDILTRMIYSEFKLRLPELLLMRVDKITMSNSLEARVPFLDHELVEFTMSIPMSDKIKNNEPKYLLKKAVEDLLPKEIIYRKKMGFASPMSDWLIGEFGKMAEEKILNSSMMKRDFFKIDFIEKLFWEHRNKKRENSVYIWTLYNLVAWYDFWIN